MDYMDEDTERTKGANEWLPGDGMSDGHLHLPGITKAILEGAEQKDFHKRVRKGVRALRRYLDLKHAIPPETRAALIAVLYKAVTEELTLDQHLQKTFAQLLIRRRPAPPRLSA